MRTAAFTFVGLAGGINSFSLLLILLGLEIILALTAGTQA